MVSTNALSREVSKAIVIACLVYLLFILGSALTPGFGLPGADTPESSLVESVGGSDSPSPVDSDLHGASVNATVVSVEDASTMVVDVDGQRSTVHVAGVDTPATSSGNVNVSQFSHVSESESARECLAGVGSSGASAIREQFEGEEVLVLSASGESVTEGDSTVAFVYLRSDSSVSVSTVVVENGYGVLRDVPRPLGVDSSRAEDLRAMLELSAVSAASEETGVWAC